MKERVKNDLMRTLRNYTHPYPTFRLKINVKGDFKSV